jgi:hypothetical protein
LRTRFKEIVRVVGHAEPPEPAPKTL